MEHAFIKLVEKSKQQKITFHELKELVNYYRDITEKTGQQINWSYGNAAFPYSLCEMSSNGDPLLYLKGTAPGYSAVFVKIGIEVKEQANTNDYTELYYVQLSLPSGATHGDKGKANEFSKFLAKKLAGELHLFNGRIMYFYKR